MKMVTTTRIDDGDDGLGDHVAMPVHHHQPLKVLWSRARTLPAQLQSNHRQRLVESLSMLTTPHLFAYDDVSLQPFLVNVPCDA